jgi:hypothetical protein
MRLSFDQAGVSSGKQPPAEALLGGQLNGVPKKARAALREAESRELGEP